MFRGAFVPVNMGIAWRDIRMPEKITAVIFSGILISRQAIPMLTGTKAPLNMDWRWDSLHNQFSEQLLMLSGLHLAINWDWALAAVQKVVFPWLQKVQERFRTFRGGVL